MEYSGVDSAEERAELLSKLKSIPFAVFVTVMPEEMCLEIETISPEGTGYQWIGFDDWMVFRLNTGNKEKWSEILRKIENNSLARQDLEGTDLGNLVKYLKDNIDAKTSCSLLLASLLKVSATIQDVFYCIYGINGPQFYSDRDGLKKALSELYPAGVKWEDVDTNELRRLWEQYEKEGGGIPYIEI